MRTVPVGRDSVARVDDADYPVVSQYRWYIKRDHAGQVYARRVWDEDGCRREQFMHNLIMGVVGVDHRDHDGLNNQRANLRVATLAENNAYKRPYRGRRFKGVFQYGTRWSARVAGRHLGYFGSPEAAAAAYDDAARRMYGDFAFTNLEPLEAAS